MSRWIIEAPGRKYLAVRQVGVAAQFYWHHDMDEAIYFSSEQQAALTRMALRALTPVLFGFEETLGPARAEERVQ